MEYAKKIHLVGSVYCDSHGLLGGIKKNDSLGITFPLTGMYEIVLAGITSAKLFIVNIMVNGSIQPWCSYEMAYRSYGEGEFDFIYQFNKYCKPFKKGDILEFIVKTDEDLIFRNCMFSIKRH